ncbi:MAG: N-(5'-phosphoribosyl)anthranilate isomerase [Candidatus Bathyarchaeota archaeon BA2]|nr:MAG: N-(5'-phosphoribosyl)anthranilate isomerase [Candidatus Bathyarchaeota archaeon BA2]
MRKVRVKICGITREEDLAVAVEAGADAVGFLVGVPSSPRNLTLERAERLLKQVPVFVDSVVVTVPDSINSLVKIYDKLRPTAIQIHGEKPCAASVIREKISGARLIKTVYVKTGDTAERAKADSKAFDAILLDSFTSGKYGGTGMVHDWTLSKQIKQIIEPTPLILAGGLKPENVKEAILTVQPYAVDVASGVELRPAVKDPKKVYEFIKNAKEITLRDH